MCLVLTTSTCRSKTYTQQVRRNIYHVKVLHISLEQRSRVHIYMLHRIGESRNRNLAIPRQVVRPFKKSNFSVLASTIITNIFIMMHMRVTNVNILLNLRFTSVNLLITCSWYVAKAQIYNLELMLQVCTLGTNLINWVVHIYISNVRSRKEFLSFEKRLPK